jgi:hypothetical protein
LIFSLKTEVASKAQNPGHLAPGTWQLPQERSMNMPAPSLRVLGQLSVLSSLACLTALAHSIGFVSDQWIGADGVISLRAISDPIGVPGTSPSHTFFLTTGGKVRSVNLTATVAVASGYRDNQDLTLVADANVVAAEAVPEPGTLALAPIAFVALLFARRRTYAMARRH